MQTKNSPPKSAPVFRDARTDFKSPAYHDRIKQVMTDVRSLQEKTIIDRDRLKSRARF
jgi:hypothetical protein